MSGIINLTGGAASKVLAYDGSLNGAIGNVAALSGTPDITWYRQGIDSFGNTIATTYFDGTNWNIQIGTLSGTVITWGSPVVISGTQTVANAAVAISLLSSTMAIIAYGDNEGTKKVEVKTYAISGNTPTLDQTTNVDTADGLTVTNCSLARANSGRVILAYKNASTYPTVVGITVSSGVLTVDASAVVVQSSACGADIVIRPIGSNKFMIGYVISATPRASIITDSTTSTSSATPYDASTATGGRLMLACDNTGGVLAPATSNTSPLYLFSVSSGSIVDEYINAGATYQIARAASIMGAGLDECDKKGAALGDIDGNGYFWAAFPCNPELVSDKISALFIGIKIDAGNVEDNLIQVVKPISTNATNRAVDSLKMIAIDSTTFVFFYIDSTNADYKYLVGKL